VNNIKATAIAMAVSLVACGQGSPPDTTVKGRQDTPFNAQVDQEEGRVSGTSTRFVYKAAETEVTEIFDVDRGMMTVTSYDKVLRSTDVSPESEFGGALLSCDSSLFKCLESGISVAVPRRLPWPRMWETHGLACQLLTEVERDGEKVFIAQCKSDRSSATTFEYSQGRGIIAFQQKCSDCGTRKFVLLSDLGLFHDKGSGTPRGQH
jgi:hypothetical protein